MLCFNGIGVLKQEGHRQYALNHFVSYKLLPACTMSFFFGSMTFKLCLKSRRGSPRISWGLLGGRVLRAGTRGESNRMLPYSCLSGDQSGSTYPYGPIRKDFVRSEHFFAQNVLKPLTIYLPHPICIRHFLHSET